MRRERAETKDGSACGRISCQYRAFFVVLKNISNRLCNIDESYVGFGSTALGAGVLGSAVELIDGTNTGSAKSLSMQWRERNANDLNALLVSDVLNLSGMSDGGGANGGTETKPKITDVDIVGPARSGLGPATLFNGNHTGQGNDFTSDLLWAVSVTTERNSSRYFRRSWSGHRFCRHFREYHQRVDHNRP